MPSLLLLVALLTGQLNGLTEANKLEAHDVLRLNLASSPGASFPNGRRLDNDVLDVLVQVAAGVFLDSDGIINKLNGEPNDPGQGVPFSALRDGVDSSGQPLLGPSPTPPRRSPHSRRATPPLGASRHPPRGTG